MLFRSLFTGSNFQTSGISSLGTTNYISGSNITLLSGSFANPFGTLRTPFLIGTAGTESITYDVNGNVTSISYSGQTETITYDSLGKVTTMVYNINGTNFTGSVSYDSQSRVSSVVYTT